VIGVMASILPPESWRSMTAGNVPATVAAISDAVRWAEEIMREIDQRFLEHGPEKVVR
jgi:F420-0:gamma-glutamyl ligase-like protein